MKDWTAKEYLIFTGTDNYSWVQNHPYAVLEAKEVKVSGTTRKMVKMRNPWGSSKWAGAFAAGTADFKKLQAALPNMKLENGMFWMEFKDFLRQYTNVYMAFS